MKKAGDPFYLDIVFDADDNSMVSGVIRHFDENNDPVGRAWPDGSSLIHSRQDIPGMVGDKRLVNDTSLGESTCLSFYPPGMLTSLFLSSRKLLPP